MTPTESATILLLRRILYAGRKDIGSWWRTANISGDLMDEVERFLGQVDGAPARDGAWAVRVLDAWAERHPGDMLGAIFQDQMGNTYWECPGEDYLHTAATPDAARIAAATALVAADPTLDPDKPQGGTEET
jgi:hypothetical protein